MSKELEPIVKYKALLVLGRRIYQKRYVFKEIPETITYGSRTLRLKMVLWNCNNNSSLDKHKFIEIALLIYR